ncbi:hypothetical protein RN001_009829 [Aquatica leii]|uniref:O-acyltransferase WSD1 C-terminal domain-containing protein n=1 Tax=Aquatica leii TaxID=1421715 RepID=A0AAN7QGU8_9COLE|nr:hypothetical protein RN001_009829 [Aquatica leii]
MNGLILLVLSVLLANIYIVQKNNDGLRRVSILGITFGVLVIILLIPLILTIVLVFATYRQCLNMSLKLKHGQAYRGLLQGFDVVHTVDEISNSKTCILIIFEYDQKNLSKCFFDVFIEEMTKVKKTIFSQIPKFQSKYSQCTGYTYMLKQNVDVVEFVRKMPLIDSKSEELNDAELSQLLGKVHRLDFPKDNTVYWDFLVGTQPVAKKYNNGKNSRWYPVLFRNHHCISDGVSLLKLLVGVLADKQTIKLPSPDTYRGSSVFDDIINSADKLSFDYLIQSLWNTLMKILLSLYVFVLIPSSVFTILFLKANDNNVLHKQALSGKPIFAFVAEENDAYFQKVKRIKHKIANTSFPEVLLTAFSESLCSYFKKKANMCPEFITSAIPIVPGSSQLQHLVPGSVNVNNITFQNNYSLVLLNLPLFIKNGNASFVRRLKLLQKQITILSNSVDYHVMYVLMNFVFSVLPTKLIRIFLYNFQCTTSVSIVPGPIKATYADNALTLIDAGFWIPHLKNIGLGFSVFTYDRRLFIGISVDTELIDSYEEAKSILDDVLRNIDLFEQEVESSDLVVCS